GQASSTQISMSLFLGFVINKMSLVYSTYKADKMATRRGEEDRREEANPSRKGWARPAQYLRAFPGFPWGGSWVGLRRAKLCESRRRALLCAIPSRFFASQTLLLRRTGS